MGRKIIRQTITDGQRMRSECTVNLKRIIAKVHLLRMNGILINFFDLLHSGGNDDGLFCSMMVNSPIQWMIM